MKTAQLSYSEKNNWSPIPEHFDNEAAQLVLVFGNRRMLKKNEPFAYLQQLFPKADIAGCSTSGEIAGENVFDDHIIATAIQFDSTLTEVAEVAIQSMEESYAVGQKIAQKLNKKGLKHVLVLSEGLNINGSELTKGLNEVLENKVPVTGGLAGDQAEFAETVIVHNQPGRTNIVVAIGFFGDNLQVGYGSMGGWDSFGVDREVTRSTANILYELDGQPALELYKRYLGDHATRLPASALLFPLNMTFNNSETSVVRTVLSVNENDGSMVFAGDIPTGSFVRLMKASFDRLIDGANDAAEMSLTGLGTDQPDLAILISCVGRKLVLKQRVEEELETIRAAFGPKTSITGFYSYGEICPLKPFDQHCELHNQTMTVTVFKES